MTSIRSGDGTAIEASSCGEGDPIVVVHGTTGSGDGWALVAPLLADDFRVITYDRRGRGGSGDGPDYSLEREVEDLLAVMAWAGGPVHLVGHSFGARVAMRAAPDAALSTLVLYEPPLAMDAVPSQMFAAIDDADRGGRWEEVLDRFLPLAGLTAEEIAFIRADPPSWQRALDGARTVAREGAALRASPPDLDRLRALDVPTLVLIGGETTAPIFLEGIDDVVRVLDAAVVRIPGQRHIATVGAPDAFAAAVREFVRAVPGGRPL